MSTHPLSEEICQAANRNSTGGPEIESSAGHSTGSRTSSGKERSKRNSIKHGIFAKALFLKTESRAEYESLLEDLRACFRPVGILEEILVEKLAVLILRYRRFITAETAEVRKA